MQISIVEPIVQLLGIGVTVSGSSTLTVESTLTANAVIGFVGSSSLTVESTLTANAVRGLVGSSILTAETTLTVTAIRGFVGFASLTAESDLISSIVVNISSDLTGVSELNVTAALLANMENTFLSGASTLTATMFQPLNILTLPTVEYQYSNDRLMRFYGIDSGQSLIITGTTGRIVEFQTGTEIETADYYFGGGRRHVLDDTEVTAVTNAGFSELISIEGVPSGV